MRWYIGRKMARENEEEKVIQTKVEDEIVFGPLGS